MITDLRLNGMLTLFNKVSRTLACLLYFAAAVSVGDFLGLLGFSRLYCG